MNKDLFPQIKKEEAKLLSGQVLAFIGDAVQTLYIRGELVLSHDLKTGKLHELVADRINATAQAKKINSLLSSLTEEEMDIFKRGRNASVDGHTRNASVESYKLATGYEALIGYLYLIGEYDRLVEIMEE